MTRTKVGTVRPSLEGVPIQAGIGIENLESPPAGEFGAGE